ncbi:MAG: KH domain-containing protein, partial [Bacteroidales bacterium]|nr:KH domain-containing protein [Bacteroidales bacterium]
ARIHGIVRELRNENIDVINYTPRLDIMVQRALAPAKVSSLKVDEEEKKIEVFMEPDQVSLAIGKGGCNIKLASKLVGFDIDVYRTGDEDSDDVELKEFADDIDQWIIDVLINIGCDTAKSVLALSKEELISRTDLEEETVDEVIRILKAEFEDDEEAKEHTEENKNE